jgi:hypothetical protein
MAAWFVGPPGITVFAAMLLETSVWADNPVAATGLLLGDGAPPVEAAGCDWVVVPAAAGPDFAFASPVSRMLTRDVV